MAKEFKITSLRLAELEKELNYLKTTREREIAAMIAEARSYGDLSENSEYDAAKNEQAKLYGRIAEIEDVLSHAVIIEDETLEGDRDFGELCGSHQGCQVPFRPPIPNVGLLLRRCSGKGLHLAMTGEPASS